MKKVILVAVAAIFTTGAFAQGIEWGAKAGVNIANISKTHKDNDANDMRIGFQAGVFGECVINNYFGVQAELLYSQMGAKSEVTALNVKTKTTAKYDYLVLPVFAKLYVTEDLTVNVGPQFGYMISGKVTTETGGHKTTNNVAKNDDDLKKFDVSALLGLNYTINSKFDVYARYNLGLTGTYEKAKGDGQKAPKNNVISVGVGYRF